MYKIHLELRRLLGCKTADDAPHISVSGSNAFVEIPRSLGVVYEYIDSQYHALFSCVIPTDDAYSYIVGRVLADGSTSWLMIVDLRE